MPGEACGAESWQVDTIGMCTFSSCVDVRSWTLDHSDLNLDLPLIRCVTFGRLVNNGN